MSRMSRTLRAGVGRVGVTNRSPSRNSPGETGLFCFHWPLLLFCFHWPLLLYSRSLLLDIVGLFSFLLCTHVCLAAQLEGDTRATHMQRTCNAHATHMQRTCNTHATHMQRTCNAHATHMQRTCNAHATHMQRTCNIHAQLQGAVRVRPALRLQFPNARIQSGRGAHGQGIYNIYDVCACVRVCVCVCVRARARVCVCMFTNTHIYLYIRIYTYICTYTRARTHTHTHTHTQTHTHRMTSTALPDRHPW